MALAMEHAGAALTPATVEGHAAACPCLAQRGAADVEIHRARGLVAVLARLFLDEGALDTTAVEVES